MPSGRHHIGLQPHQALDVVGRALERDGQFVARQRDRAHELAAQVVQLREDVLDAGAPTIDGLVAGLGTLAKLMPRPGLARDAVLPAMFGQYLAVGLVVVAAVGIQPCSGKASSPRSWEGSCRHPR